MKLLTMEQLCDKLSCTRTTVYRLMELGGLPQPLKLATGGLRWVDEHVDEVVLARGAEVDGPLPCVLLTTHEEGVEASLLADGNEEFIDRFKTVSDALETAAQAARARFEHDIPVRVIRGVMR